MSLEGQNMIISYLFNSGSGKDWMKQLLSEVLVLVLGMRYSLMRKMVHLK